MPGAAPRYTIGLEDVARPERLLEVLQRLIDHDYDLLSKVGEPTTSNQQPVTDNSQSVALDLATRILSLENLVEALSVGGSDSVAPAQRAAIPTVTELPPVASSAEGDTVLFNNGYQTFSGGAWVPGSQSLTGSVDGEFGLAVTNTSTGTSARADLRVVDDASVVGDFRSHSSTRVATRYGVTLAKIVELLASNGSLGLLIGSTDNVPIVFGTNSLERLRIDSAGAQVYSGANGAKMTTGWNSELLTLSTVGLTTDTAANILPSGALIRAVLIFNTVAISGGGVASINAGDPTTATRFATGGSLGAGSGLIGTAHMQGNVTTTAAGPTQNAADKVRITAVGGTPTAGQVRIVVFYDAFTPPTS